MLRLNERCSSYYKTDPRRNAHLHKSVALTFSKLLRDSALVLPSKGLKKTFSHVSAGKITLSRVERPKRRSYWANQHIRKCMGNSYRSSYIYPCTHKTGGCVRPTAGQKAVEKGLKFSASRPEERDDSTQYIRDWVGSRPSPDVLENRKCPCTHQIRWVGPEPVWTLWRTKNVPVHVT